MSVPAKICLVSLVILLAACGGGGSSPGPGSTNPPGGTPGGGTTPPPENFNTTEYQANWGLAGVNALAAYDDGLSGDGMTIAVIDSGIDLDQSELTPNIHVDSKDIFDGGSNTITAIGGATTTFSELRPGGADLDDLNGHGTFVAGLIGAQRNGVRMHGLAFDAKMLVIRTDSPGSCATDCVFDDNPIAASLNYAVAHGADVVNMSLGGSAATAYLEGAIRDATAAGVVLVFSAGNAAELVAPFTPSANADPLSLAAIESWGNASIIIAGASNDIGTITDFSNRAGAGAPFFLLAPGEDVYSTAVVTATGASTFGTGSGTSFAAPSIAAAAALLMEKFPSLTAAEVVDILLTSATDIGAAGVDPINGHGILNLAAAIAPIGTTSLTIQTANGTIVTDPGDGGLVVGGLFGDGFGAGFKGGAVFTDAYDRAYTTSFENQIQLIDPFADFQSRFDAAQSYETARVELGGNSTLAVGANYDRPQTAYEEAVAGLSLRQDETLSQVKIRIETNIGDRAAMSYGFGGPLEDALDSKGGSAATGIFLGKGARLPWLSDTSSGADDAGVMAGGRRYGATLALSGGFVLSAAAGEDEIGVPGYEILATDGLAQARRASTAARLGRSSRHGDWAVTVGRIEEKGTVLGSFSSGPLGLGRGAKTDFLAVSGETVLGELGGSSLSAFGHLAGAAIAIDEEAGSAFSGFEGMRASQFAVGLALDNAGLGGNRLSLTLSQPLRLETGRVVYGFASGYDYNTDTPLFDASARSLAPSGRELDLELAWHFGLGERVRVSTNLLYQRDPGHIAGRNDNVAVMITGRSAF